MSGGGGLSKLGIVLTVIFAISLLALIAELFYVLWRRRVFRRQTNTVGVGGDEVSRYSSSESTFSPVASSKELLYFFCIRPHFCHQRDSVTAENRANDLNSNHQSDVELIDIDLLKIQGVFGPPRFLFTIKEEEREDVESPATKSICPVTGKDFKEKIDDDNRSTVSLEECFRAVEEPAAEEVALEIDDRGVDNVTPFSTPCASPIYFTPSASPIHEMASDRSPEEGLITCQHQTSPIARSED